jgi:DnaJ-class molecular chaperone
VTTVAARKTTAKQPPAPVAPCEPCKGTGEVSRTVRVGRKQRTVGQQAGICLACFGTGEATD